MFDISMICEIGGTILFGLLTLFFVGSVMAGKWARWPN
jgi:hypothetical protein